MATEAMDPSTILITGGNGYLGGEMARGLAEDGHNIVVGYFVDKGIEDLLAELREIVKAVAVRMDIRDFASIESAMTQAGQELDTPSGVIACSAIQENVEAGHIPSGIIEEVIRTNVLGTTNTFELGLRCIAQARNRVNRFLGAIGSITARQSFPGLAVYGATKNYVDGLVRTYAAPAAKIGARTWSVRPGAIPHPGKEVESPGYAKAWSDFGLMPQVGTPQDVANTVRFLASEQARHITGTPIDVDGGSGLVFQPPIKEVQTPEEALRRFREQYGVDVAAQ